MRSFKYTYIFATGLCTVLIRLKNAFADSLIVLLSSDISHAVEDVQNVQIVCVWCQKEGVKRYSLCMGSELKSFCSEKCFAACRRAYFKRNKVSVA